MNIALGNLASARTVLRCVAVFSIVAAVSSVGLTDDSATTKPATADHAARIDAGAPSANDCSALIRKAAATGGSPLERVQANLAAARCLLVYSCAGPLSAELCWTATPGTQLAPIVREARACLERCDEAMKKLGDLDEAVQHELTDRRDMLAAFAGLFDAMAELDASSDKSVVRLIDACIGVSAYLDDPNPGVAESAKLWQSVAYRRAGRPDRSLQILWPAIGRLSSSRIDFFARIERCRSLADRGLYVSALALAMKLEEHRHDWLSNEDETAVRRAEDSLRWTRVILNRRWAESLRTAGEEERAKTAEAAAEKLLGDDPYPPPPDRWLQLSETIAGLPDWNQIVPSTSQPAREKP